MMKHRLLLVKAVVVASVILTPCAGLCQEEPGARAAREQEQRRAKEQAEEASRRKTEADEMGKRANSQGQHDNYFAKGKEAPSPEVLAQVIEQGKGLQKGGVTMTDSAHPGYAAPRPASSGGGGAYRSKGRPGVN